ncbi:hypothetical protein [Legionella fallonii]|uniref:FlaG protein n=1 Tax=Legionella fallonii LLAP-10 TaxID=1212491 RepID=A0A098G3Y5_9GAMM|nr:hypothetical protein [Legionella fallonii]CEG56691.1 conserved protein of unknown function [Legionella fallonii LLAP-10]
MDIKPLQSVNTMIPADSLKLANETIENRDRSNLPDNYADAETKHTLDNATGLLQTIVTDKLSDKVIRKMPSDEYLRLLSLLDNIINGSIDKHV